MDKIKRTTTHILKYCNSNKQKFLDKLFIDYNKLLKIYVDMLINKQLPLRALLSSTELPSMGILEHSQWRQIVYKNASEIVRGAIQANKTHRYNRYKIVYNYFKSKNRMRKFTSKKFKELNLKPRWVIYPHCENTPISLDERVIDIKSMDNSYFDEFVRIKLPYFKPGVKRAYTINIPLKYHQHSKKYKDWDRKKTIQLVKKGDGSYYFNIFWEKDMPGIKTSGLSLGIDVGYHKLMVTSNHQMLGGELESIYKRISLCKNGSKHFKRLLKLRDTLYRKCINNLDLTNIKTIFVEDLKGIKQRLYDKSNKHSCKNFRKVVQYCQLSLVYKLLKRKCEEQGVQIVKVSPAYTSQTCSRCKIVDKSNRHGEQYICKNCGLQIDADYNASINILNRGVYSPPGTDK